MNILSLGYGILYIFNILGLLLWIHYYSLDTNFVDFEDTGKPLIKCFEGLHSTFYQPIHKESHHFEFQIFYGILFQTTKLKGDGTNKQKINR